MALPPDAPPTFLASSFIKYIAIASSTSQATQTPQQIGNIAGVAYRL